MKDTELQIHQQVLDTDTATIMGKDTSRATATEYDTVKDTDTAIAIATFEV